MLDKITANEKEMINYYRNFVAQKDGLVTVEPMCSIEHFLRHWASNKGWLYRLFGEKLIISKPVTYQTPKSAILKLVEDEWYNDDKSILVKFAEHFYDKLCMYLWGCRQFEKVTQPPAYCYPTYDNYWNNWDICADAKVVWEVLRFDLLTTVTLAESVWIYDSRKIKMPKSGKIINLIKNQTKIMRVIQSLIEELDLDKHLFEEFRIKHSTFFNQAKLTGELCVSIHPLDFITMSENSLKWQSCMNWRKNGCYRRGTIEMMNSGCVVVAYLKNASKPFTFGTNKEYQWNNKMWRSLFVIDDDFIVGIKGYPYDHDEMTKDALEMLRELLNTNTNYKLISPVEHWNYEDGDHIEFETNAMYNDFGTTDDCCHWAIFGNNHCRTHNYSGESECVWCGDSECDNQEYSELFACSEEDLTCKRCSGFIGFCNDCGRRIRMGECIVWDGAYGPIHYCHECFDHRVRTCPITGEMIHTNQLSECGGVWLFVLDNDNHIEYQFPIKDKCWETHPDAWARIFGNARIEPIANYSSGRPFADRYEIHICDLTPEQIEFCRKADYNC